MKGYFYKTIRVEGGSTAVELSTDGKPVPDPSISIPGMGQQRVIDVKPVGALANTILTGTQGDETVAMTRETLKILLASEYMQGRKDGAATQAKTN